MAAAAATPEKKKEEKGGSVAAAPEQNNIKEKDNAVAAAVAAATRGPAQDDTGTKGDMENAGGGESAVSVPEKAPSILEAIQWATGVRDMGILEELKEALPEHTLQEQMRLFKAHKGMVKEVRKVKIQVKPDSLRSRNALCEAYDTFLKNIGKTPTGKRKPRGQLARFLDENVTWSTHFMKPRTKKETKALHQQMRRWFEGWSKEAAIHQKKAAEMYTRRAKKPNRVEPAKRQRRLGTVGVHKLAAPLVRQQLFEWFIALRYSIDWKKYNQDCRSRGDHKSIGRFPRSVLRTKVKQLLADYLEACLRAAVPAKGVSPRGKWFREWECDYGLTMLQPNRKFKVARHVLDQRVRLWWISVYRIRALAVELLGNDPEVA